MENLENIVNDRLQNSALPSKSLLKKVELSTVAVAQKALPKQVNFKPMVEHQVTYGNKLAERYGKVFIHRLFPLREPVPKPDDRIHCKEGHKKMEAMYNQMKLKKNLDNDEVDYMEAAEEIMAYFDGSSEITLDEKPAKKEPQLFNQQTINHLAEIEHKSTIRTYLNTPSWNDPELDASLSQLLAEALVELNLSQPASEVRNEVIQTMMRKRIQNDAPQVSFTKEEFYSLYADLFLKSKPRTGDTIRFLPHTLFNEVNESYMKARLEEKLDIQFLPNSYDVKYALFPSKTLIADLVDDLIRTLPP